MSGNWERTSFSRSSTARFSLLDGRITHAATPRPAVMNFNDPIDEVIVQPSTPATGAASSVRARSAMNRSGAVGSRRPARSMSTRIPSA